MVPELVEGMRDLLTRTLGPMVNLQGRHREGQHAVCSDPTQLEMAVLNMAINAATRCLTAVISRSRTCSVQLAGMRRSSRATTLNWRYRFGTGMGPEVAARVFEPFFTNQGHRQRHRLGLSRLRDSRQGQGTARIESSPGHGTTVRVRAATCRRQRNRMIPGQAGELEARWPVREFWLSTMTPTFVASCSIHSKASATGLRSGRWAVGSAALEQFEPDLLLVDYAMRNEGGGGSESRQPLRPGLPIFFASGMPTRSRSRTAAGDQALILRKRSESLS